jgi:DNA polymerase-3 subunit epsilon
MEGVLNFVCIDFETANCSCSSICQVGIVRFKDGVIVGKWSTLVDPEDYFDSFNTAIHGIKAEDVKGSPTFREIFATINFWISDQILVSHSSFDIRAMSGACEKYGLTFPEFKWLDTTRVARRTWREVSQKGFGLANLAERLKIKFIHHNAEEDAMAAGMVLLAAIQESGTSLEEWLDLSLERHKIDFTDNGINPNGPLSDEVLVFTGKLSMIREEAVNLAKKAGCRTESGVTKNTTILILGEQDIGMLAPGKEISAKLEKVLALKKKGQKIRILSEKDFIGLVTMG